MRQNLSLSFKYFLFDIDSGCLYCCAMKSGCMGYSGIIIAASLIFLANCIQSAGITPERARLGINLSGPADWNTEHPFVDVFKLSRKWISQKKGEAWGKGPELERDENGWIKRLDADCWVETPILTGGYAPVGEYVCLYDGDGIIDFSINAKVVSRAPGKVVVNLTPTKGGTFLVLRQTNPTNYVRNIRVIMPGFVDKYQTEPFEPRFLKRWCNFNTFRFMDWMLTNNSKQRSWKDRPTTNYCNYTERGVPIEVMVNLCNQLGINPWFCMPHLADDEYVEQFAILVKKLLRPDLKIYIEYSNEVWNSMFAQNRYAADRAKELGIGPAERPWEGAAKYYAQRSVEIFKIWEKVFGGTERIVRVIAWQAAGGEYWSDKMVLSHKETYKNTDALAIAPYFSMNISPKGKPDAETVSKWSVEQVLDYAETNSIAEAVRWIKTQKKVADKYGLSLICYEAGQHFVGVAGAENNVALTKLLISANKHPRIGALYKKYLDAWRDVGGGDLMCIFSSVGSYSKWGSWGLLENALEDGSPKYDAVIKWLTENPKR